MCKIKRQKSPRVKVYEARRIYTTRELWDRVKAEAKRESVTASAWIVGAVKRALGLAVLLMVAGR